MKVIVLEHPRIASVERFNDIANTPLWSCLMGGYAASALKQAGFEALLINDATPQTTFEKTRQNILDIDPDVLCVNTVYFWEHTSKLFEFFATLKKDGFKGHINLFGFFPTLAYQNILSSIKAVDSIALGEFEHTLVELIIALEKKEPLNTIQGLALQSGEENLQVKPRTPERNPDHFAFPKRVTLEGTVTILASRGCYNHCSFCPVPSFYNQGSLWKGRSPENIFREMKELVSQGAKEFYFADPNFIGPGRTGKKRILELLRLIKPLKITFGMETRPNDLDDEIMEELVQAGFTSLLMGIESGSGNILRHINKSSAANTGTRAIELCRRHGIEPEIGFLMFVPDSNINDLKENIAFLQENNLLDRLERTANLLSHNQIVLAGTSGYAEYDTQNRLDKSGLFGFEADVLFLDPKVEWISHLVVFACHLILKSMARNTSPIYWKDTSVHVSQKANQYLIDLFSLLVSEVEANATLNQVLKRQEIISREINAILK